MLIERRPLRDDIRDALLRLLFTGQLEPASNINEAELCRQLGVSRTPLREALLMLEQEGLLESQTNRGWWVTPLSVDVVGEIYPILAALEALALQSSDLALLTAAAKDLERINKELLACSDVAEAEVLDDRWHARLMQHCANVRLLAMIEGLKRLAHRYEVAYAAECWDVSVSARQHAAITSALKQSDLPAALRALQANWDQAREALTEWLTNQLDKPSDEGLAS